MRDIPRSDRQGRAKPLGCASGSRTQFLECRAFQTVEVAFAGGRLLKDVLRHFKRRDGFSD